MASAQAGVADSGFSTEASAGSSNSNTSPRSSRFDAGGGVGGPADHLSHPPPPPMEKELVQHLERVQQRLARLRKDEDRLLTLLNPARTMRHHPPPAALPSSAGAETDDDELWHLLEEIQVRSRALQLDSQNATAAVSKATADDARTSDPTHVKQTSSYRLDRKTVSAVLKLNNPVHLQRHLLRALLANQVRCFFSSFK